MNKQKIFAQLLFIKNVVLIKATIIIFVTAVIYNQDLSILINEAIASEQTSYILIIPLLASYLIYRKRRFLNSVTSSHPSTRDEITGIAFCALALTLYLVGSYTFYPLGYHILSLPIFLFGCILLLFNLETLKALAFPIAFLFLLTPLPFETLYTIGGIMANHNTYTKQHH